MLRSLGQNPSDSELHDLINQADYNKNGVIEFDEFLDMMTRDYETNDQEAQLLNAFRFVTVEIRVRSGTSAR